MALFQKAIRLDPTFAAAYAALGLTLRSLGETKLAAENTRKAYELRQGVSEPERLFLECQYHEVVTGNLEKARQAYELWEQTYPRNPTPPNNLGGIYSHLGQYDAVLLNYQKAEALNPDNALTNAGLARAYSLLGRLDEAKAVAKQAQAKRLDSPYLHYFLYIIAFLQNDDNAMDEQVRQAVGKPGVEDILLNYQAERSPISAG